MDDMKNRLNILSLKMQNLRDKKMENYYENPETFRAVLRLTNATLARVRHVRRRVNAGETLPPQIVERYYIEPKQVIDDLLNPIEDKYKVLQEDLEQLKELVDASARLMGFKEVKKNLSTKLDDIEKSVSVPLIELNLFAADVKDEYFRLCLLDFVKRVRAENPLACHPRLTVAGMSTEPKHVVQEKPKPEKRSAVIDMSLLQEYDLGKPEGGRRRRRN